MPVIYLDVLLFLNLFADFWLLSSVARLLHIPHRGRRIVGGAAAGAAASLILLLPPLPLWLTLCIELLSAAVMTAIAFRFAGWRSFGVRIGVLFLLSTLFAGVSYLLWLLVSPAGFTVRNGVVYYDVSPLWLAATTLISYGAIRLYDRAAAHRLTRRREYRVTVTHRGKAVTVDALHDTGNRLREQFTGSPVIVADRDSLAPLSLPDFSSLWEREEGTRTAAEYRLRMIPFSSVGGGGLLPAFRPDRVTVSTLSGEHRIVDGGYIALTPALGRGPYHALLGDDVAALFQKEGLSCQ